MSSLKRWHSVGGAGGDLHKWDKPGDSLEGIWKGTTPGKFGDLGVLQLESGQRIRFPIHTVLVDKLRRLKPDAEIQIIYHGKTRGQSGTEYKDFSVAVADPQMLLDAMDEDAPTDDAAPF